MVATKEAVTIKVPRVPDFIRKEKKEVKLHIEEARRLLATNFRKVRGEHLVRYLGASYDDFRKEVWVVSRGEDHASHIIYCHISSIKYFSSS